MYSLAIIGGGATGTSILLNLPNSIRNKTIIIDKNPSPLYLFLLRCQNVGMRFLRSPASHTLIEPISPRMLSFGKEFFKPHDFEGPYYNPSLRLFKHYIKNITQKMSLHWIQNEVTDITSDNNLSWIIRTPTSVLQTKRIILALGAGDSHIPKEFQNVVPSEDHILHPNFSHPPNSPRKNIAIVGGGMSGTQCALTLSKHHNVTLIIPHKFRVSYFDSNVGFVGPKYQAFFEDASLDVKLKILKQEKYLGSINPYVFEQINNAYTSNLIDVKESKLLTAAPTNKGFTLTLANSTTLDVNQLIFATGFERQNTTYNPLVSKLIRKYNLPLTSKQKIPLLEHNTLEWYPNLFLAGILGELSIGPSAGSFIGAHIFTRKMKETWRNW